MTIKNKIRKIKKQLRQLEEEGRIDYEISYRGGHYGLKREEAWNLLKIPEKDRIEEYFPPKIGVYCNYLGGGIRGAIVGGGYSSEVSERTAKKIEDFYSACKQRYEEIETEWANDPESFTDEWNEKATRRARAQGIVSAY